LIAESLRVLGAKATVPTAADMVLDFFRGRLKAFFAEKYPADSVEAVLAAGFDDLVAVEQRLAALAAVRTEADFTALAAAFKRAGNILEKAPADTPAEPDSSALSTDEERALLDAVQHTRERIRDADGNYTEALRALAAVKPQVDAFFDKVLVMDPDEAVRRNRFALLKSVTGLFSGIADFSQLQS
jgi:glycyl-tRNA synthetase beta chain